MMSENTEATQFTEAPASINIKAYAPSGFDVMLTLRSADGSELMPRALKALTWLTDQVFTPTRNGYGRAPAGNTATEAADGAPLCPTHGRPMKPSKFGDGYFCTVKIADDDGTGKPAYCKQKA
jgi:hypothetical protein